MKLIFRQIRRSQLITFTASLVTDAAPKPKPILRFGARTKKAMFVEAVVCNTTDLSSSVRGLTLKVNDSQFTFKPGQWVDLVVPGVKEVAGYSICSTPQTLEKTGTLELAVKYSDFPITDWLHKKCEVGSTVQIAPGGDFCYPSSNSEQNSQSASLQQSDKQQSESLASNLLLIAGGVGINPLISIMRHVAEQKDCNQLTPERVMLAYSARSLQDLVFRDDIIRMVNEHSSMCVEFFVTRFSQVDMSLPVQEFPSVTFKNNTRVDTVQLSRILEENFLGNIKNIDCFVCGPPGLIDDTNVILPQLGMSPEQIKYEKWW